MKYYFSFIIPVYNRPDEIDELLSSMQKMEFEEEFEVVIVEDGSQQTSEEVIEKYGESLQISYYKKENTGPGDSRNYGMQKAKGDYFLILDSDCLLPKHYLREVTSAFDKDFVHCFGGPDAAHSSFSPLQKAINYSMTSLFTTGGIRGKNKSVGKFQPRSFNMGLSKEAFQKTNGFGRIHPGEDPDLAIRIWKAGYETRLFEKAFVYHKRRISFTKFYQQVHKFGLVRPILNTWHPETAKLVFWFPLLFCLALLCAIMLSAIGFYFAIIPFAIYFLVLTLDSTIKNRSLLVGLMSLPAVLIQFYGYGSGFINTTINVAWLKKDPEKAYPKLFFKK
ncbi:glycosyltransferase [Spongiivirga citrea]|uniref:Glycosyltransferase n=1 Tax=Spongiivirga citrea TaxID=1481457 RepID=A0A6M0CKT9_9FLAO|nr:glycosyltransferase [Spongiivirga citrea]NER17603.1 glycosyltransferase [Spongiivirga citrea]